MVVLACWMLACTSSVETATGGGAVGGSAEGGSDEGGTHAGGSDTGGGGASACGAPEGEATFVVGTGELCFEPMKTGDVVAQYSGPQGGYHMFASIGCSDCGEGSVVKLSALSTETGEPLSFSNEFIGDFKGGPMPSLIGLQVSMPGVSWDPEMPPLSEGDSVRVDVEITKDAEVLHAESLVLTVGKTLQWSPCTAHPEDPCCVQKCDGF